MKRSLGLISVGLLISISIFGQEGISGEPRTPGTDHATALLKITYDGGKIKTIKDYGMLGTYSLSRTYHIMDFLRRSEVWKRELVKAIIPLPANSN